MLHHAEALPAGVGVYLVAGKWLGFGCRKVLLEE